MAAPVLLDQDAIIGFGFGKMKSFCAGCFLSALGSFKRFPSRARQAWFVTTEFHTQLPPPAAAELSRHRAGRRGNIRSDLKMRKTRCYQFGLTAG
jgi:hypothetical protein